MSQNNQEDKEKNQEKNIFQPSLISAPKELLDSIKLDPLFAQYSHKTKKKFRVFFHQGLGLQVDIKRQQFILNLLKEDPLSDSFQVYDKQVHIQRITQFHEKLPWIKPHFAVKCNPRPEFLSTFIEQDNNSAFDVASLDEIYAVLNFFKANPKNIVYCNSTRSELDITYAKQMNVTMLNADTIEEILKLKLLSDQSVQLYTLQDLKIIVQKLYVLVRLERLMGELVISQDDLNWLKKLKSSSQSEDSIDCEEISSLQTFAKEQIAQLKQELKVFQGLTRECSSFPFQILWRIACIPDEHIEREKNTSDIICLFEKFGDQVYEGKEYEIRDKFMVLKELGVDLKGVHFHSGSGYNGSKNFDFSIDMAKRVMKIGRQCGHTMNILDIGGGFPGHELTDKLIHILERCKPDQNSKLYNDDITDYQVYAEPGRHFATQTYYGLVRVIGSKVREGQKSYEINDGVYNMLSPIWQDHFQMGGDQIYAGLNSDGTKIDLKTMQKTPCTIYGQTCDSIDKVVPYQHGDKQVMLPSDLEVGDWICIGGLGAYSASVTTKFNQMRALSKVCIMNIPIEQENLNSSQF